MCQTSGRTVSQLFGHLDQELTRLTAFDLVERLDDADRAARLQEAENALGIACLACRGARPAAEEERDRYFQRFGDPLQAARADAVHTLLVLLHLLEGDSNTGSKLGLR